MAEEKRKRYNSSKAMTELSVNGLARGDFRAGTAGDRRAA